ncbi:MAG: ATP-binding cassette domain-containing protein [Spirochaetales bacterium]|nr:ATP-binding cassette domain-containing protein [Spirochaetales bacterium]
MSEERSPLLKLGNIHISFGAVKALRGMDFDLYRGEIHALVGDHRAGKSTLVKMLSGDLRKEKGTIHLNEKKIDYFTPKTAMVNKIGIVHQQPSIIPSLNAVENIYAGRMKNIWMNPGYCRELAGKCEELFRRLGVHIDLKVRAADLSFEERQMVEIARALSLSPDILILDEITGKLSTSETEHLFRILKEYKEQDKAIIYISQDVEEVFRFADRVTVLKNGQRRGTENVRDLDRLKLLKMTYSFMLNEEEDEKTHRQLFLHKRFNESIINNLPVSVIIFDANNTVFISNHAAQKLLDFEKADTSGIGIRELLPLARINRIEEVMEKILARERSVWENLTLNNEKFINIKTYPLKDEDNTFMGTILLLEDVSMDHFIKEYLVRAEKISSIAELAAGVAHEINNPLEIIKNYVELLKRKNKDPDSAVKLTKIEGELKRLVEIVGSLLSFSRVKQIPDKKFDVIQLLDEVTLLLSHMLKTKRIKLNKQVDHGAAFVTGDENKLKQLFINLIMNSIEAVLDDGVINLYVRKDPDNGYVEISIEDNGYGIPLEIQEEIFTPFFTTKMTKKNTGLGLTICQYIVESHKGVITFKSEPGYRTIFTLRFPLAPE